MTESISKRKKLGGSMKGQKMRQTIIMLIAGILIATSASCNFETPETALRAADASVPVIAAAAETGNVLLTTPAADMLGPGLRMGLWILTVLLSGASGAYQDWRAKQ
ncbi:MAG: hypothetical protein WC372_10840 [Candidatus Neomarinimicrobiota bacterium]